MSIPTLSEGTNALIADHAAVLTRDLDDILNALDRVGESLRQAGAPEAVAAAARPDIPLNDTERRLMDLLAAQDLDLDELVRRSALPSSSVIAAMTTLAIKRLVTRQPGGVFSARARPDGPT